MVRKGVEERKQTHRGQRILLKREKRLTLRDRKKVPDELCKGRDPWKGTNSDERLLNK